MSLVSSAKAVKIISKVVARANTDPTFKASLLSDPSAALSNQGLSIPPGIAVHFVDAGAPIPKSTASDVYLQLGSLDRIGDVELNEEAFTKAASGGSCHGSASTMMSAAACISSASTASTKCT
ncbi:MAG: hypothetical protein J0I17_00885 ['Candidatus Kapabacteria' thiocyanatum]|uniref:Nitrile hydratase alpha /Thiocyanate hydrolase gamma domain-containing protein n=1 Tax=Candidatus Kapaibacterium thiocyanatum TaxID=1895771 RepID=A0A1M3KWV7_9BACT|nr:hypothetical protein ['Candidatus Kapabacteria' thiocyanatum]OJX56744.1 MAG: hypothetical protein BGO89_09410 ['Candidatus Kapabacteria' thiocyanatum]